MIKFKREVKQDNFILYIPKVRYNNWKIDNGNVKLVFHHDKVIEKFMRLIAKKPRVTDISFDDISSEAWKLIDGKNTVYDIGQRLLENYGKECDPIYDRLIMFIRYLNRKNWISFEKGNQ